MSTIEVDFKLLDGTWTTRTFNSPVSLDHVGMVGDSLNSHIFNAFENGVCIGGWTALNGRWSYCGR